MRVLYLCPHGAAKSVIATALTRDLAERRGVDVVANNAGTEPDATLNPIALNALHTRGLDYADPPRRVEGADIEAADLVVTLGCDVEDLPAVPTTLIDWSDVPDASADVEQLISILEQRIAELVVANTGLRAT
ncbi:MAG: hypothetical protein KJO36_00080 [Acidimicrobiia bacterium]|nr:hypothetical protein [Acidimicrobiia bacterium]